MSETSTFQYTTIQSEAVAEYKDKGSKFLAYAFPISSVEAFKEKLADIKKMHPKANHHCFAYRLGTDENNFRASDAGEPSGTAGRPILGQIDSKEYTNTLIIVVRYFGGTLLGVPGLINAYKTASALVLQLVPPIKMNIKTKINFDFDYTKMGDVMRFVKQFDGNIIAQEMQLFCNITCEIPLAKKNEAKEVLKDFYGIEFKWL